MSHEIEIASETGGGLDVEVESATPQTDARRARLVAALRNFMNDNTVSELNKQAFMRTVFAHEPADRVMREFGLTQGKLTQIVTRTKLRLKAEIESAE